MSTETLITVEDVSKKFCRNLKKSLWYGMKDLGSEIFGQSHDGKSELRPDEFWAVKDVSFELKRGECLGLIGRNGAGKTTLLRMLNGLIKPDTGRIVMSGKVGALIALGAGFNPILTGRENIYVNAAVLGLSKQETDASIEEIIDFSEIREFIDAPVQSYSSGMSVRLGFAIASGIKPDILLLDEVLAVGDIDFQIKCGNRIRELIPKCAVIFVSHSMQYVSAFCSRAMLLGNGQIIIDSPDPGLAIGQYLCQAHVQEHVNGSGSAQVDSLSFSLSDGRALTGPNVIDQGKTLRLRLRLKVAQELVNVKLSFAIMDTARNGILSLPVVDDNGQEARFSSGVHDLEIPLGPIELNAGNYSLMVVVQDYVSNKIALRHEGALILQVRAHSMKSVAKIIRPVQVCAVSN